MVRIQPAFISENKTVAVLVSDNENDDRIIKDLALEVGYLKKCQMDCFEDGRKQVHYRFAFRNSENRELFEEKVKLSQIYDDQRERPKVFRHGAR